MMDVLRRGVKRGVMRGGCEDVVRGCGARLWCEDVL